MKLELSKLKPSKFRNFKLNPIDEGKITSLVSSYNADTFWGHTVLVRPIENDEYEIVYGHHRVEAAKRAGIKFADLTVEKLDDATALLRKSLENRPEYDTTILSLLEDTEAEVKAIAEGIVSAPKLDPKTRKDLIRFAPSYVPGEPSAANLAAHPYTTLSVAQRLNYTRIAGRGSEQPEKAVSAAIRALWLIEIDAITAKSVQGLNVDALDRMTKDIAERVTKSKVEGKKAAEVVKKATDAAAALDAERHAQEAEHKAKKNDLIQKEIDARAERDLAAAKEAIALRKQEEERQKARTELYKKRRKELEVIVDKRKQEQADAQAKDKNLPTRYAVKTMLGKLKIIPSENFPFREEVKSLSRDPAVTLMERDLLYKAMKEASQWYSEWAEKFAVTPKHTGVLSEARKREEAKRKLEDTTKENK